MMYAAQPLVAEMFEAVRNIFIYSWRDIFLPNILVILDYSLFLHHCNGNMFPIFLTGFLLFVIIL